MRMSFAVRGSGASARKSEDGCAYERRTEAVGEVIGELYRKKFEALSHL
jgi:hypothetical protein